MDQNRDIERFVRALPYPAVITTADGSLCAMNSAFRGLIGASRPCQRVAEIFEETAEDLRRYLRLCSSTVEPTVGSLRLKTADSGTVLYRCHGGLLRPAAGQREALLLITVAPRADVNAKFIELNRKIQQLNDEILARQSIEHTLRRSEEFARSIIESSRDCIKLVRLDGRLEYLASSACELLECPDLSVLIGRYWPDFFSRREDREAVEKAIATAKGGGHGRFQAYCPTFAGTPKWWDVIVAPMNDVEGRPERLLAVSRDITSMITADEKVRKAEERLNLALRATGMGAWEWNLKSGVLWWSEGLWTLHGYEPHAFVPSPVRFLEMVIPEDRDKVRQAVNEALAAGEYEVEYRAIRPDGRLRYIAALGQVFRDPESSPDSMTGICIDITERKIADETLRRAEQAAAAGRLAATIAHEINNPLEAITNLLYLARTTPESADRFLGIADQELRRLANIAKQTLSFYRSSSRQERVVIPELLDSLLEVYGRKLTSRGIEVEKRYESRNPVLIYESEARQIFSNLIANSVDAMAQGGRLVLHVRQSDAASGGPELRVVLADTGSGISREHRQRLFQPFFTTKEEGTGLGLWVAKSFVEKHGGKLRLRSSTRNGRSGTVFSISFPNVQSPTKEPENDRTTASFA